MSEITYDDKVDLQVATNIANINKVTASDMNEIKNVVNGNAEEVGDITSLTTTDKTSVVNAVNELNAPEKWVSVGATAPTDGTRVWFAKGKNLANLTKLFGDTNYYSITNGSLSVIANDGRTWDNLGNSWGIKLNAGTYILSSSNGGTTNVQIQGQNIGQIVGGNMVNGSISFTLSQADLVGIKFLNIATYPKNIGTIQLEEGSTATSYEPYVEQSINVDEEEWYVKPRVLWSGRATSVNIDLTGYSFIEVIFCSNDNFYNSLKVPVSGSTFSRDLALCNNYLSDPMESSGMLYLKYGKATLTQSGITIKSNVEVAISNTASQIKWQGATNTLLYITTIIGYK